jgi:hypothetical protein
VGPAPSLPRFAALALLVGLSVRSAAADDARPAPGAPREASEASPALPPPARATPSLAGRLDRALSPVEREELAFLDHLGWRFAYDPAAKEVEVRGGSPCRRGTLAEAHAAGDLVVAFPESSTEEDLVRFGRTLGDLAESVPSRCAWQLRVAPAVERATAKLAAAAEDGRFTFPKWAVIPALIFTMSPPEPAWVREGKVCRARTKPSTAVEAFYTEDCSTECYVAQTVAAYAAMYELLGPAAFDEAFRPDEIAVGQVWHFHQTPIGKTMNAPADYPWRALLLRSGDRGTDPGLVLARLGPSAFPGLTGILMDQAGRVRSNQNLMFVSVSPAAADSLARNGGFDFLARQSRELLALHSENRARFAKAATVEANEARMEEVLSDPAFREVRVYIHPFGVKTLGEMLDLLLRKDRTAVHFVLYDQAREDAFFRRYRETWKARWRRERAAR